MFRVGVAAPCRWLDPGALRAACGILEEEGIDVSIPDQNFQKYGQLAGDDQTRAAALHSLYKDDRIDAILCARGGYGAQRILDMIDFEIIRENPKPLIGYSDVTCLLTTIASRTESPVWHGPMLTDIASGIDDASLSRLVAVVKGNDISNPEISLSVLRSGSGKGAITGGNLSTLAALCGTKYQLETAGKFLFIEDVDEPAYVVDRLMVQIRQAGMLVNLAGLILGHFSKIYDLEKFDLSITKIVLDHCEGTKFPILSGYPLGHGRSNLAVKIGSQFCHSLKSII